MSLWGKNDNKLSDGTVSVNHANKTVIGSGTTFGGGVGYAATGDIIRFGQPFGGSTGYLGEAVITGIGNTQELFIDSTAGMSPVDITGSNYQITQSPKSSVTDSAFNKFSRGVAQAGSERLSTTLNGNVAVGGTVITTTATATGNNIVVGDNVEITHGDVFPRVQRGKVHSIATNTVRLQSALKETKSEYRVHSAAPSGTAEVIIKEAPTLSFFDGGRFGAHLDDLKVGDTFGLGLAGINTAGIGTIKNKTANTATIVLASNVKFASNVNIDEIVTIKRGAITGSKIVVSAAEDITGDETQVVGVSTGGVGAATSTAFATGAGWVGVTTYVDMHGTLRVKKDILVAMSGIQTGNLPIYDGNPLA